MILQAKYNYITGSLSLTCFWIFIITYLTGSNTIVALSVLCLSLEPCITSNYEILTDSQP